MGGEIVERQRFQSLIKVSVLHAQHRYMIAGLFNIYTQLSLNTGQMSLITAGSLSDGGLLLVKLNAALSYRLCIKDRHKLLGLNE